MMILGFGGIGAALRQCAAARSPRPSRHRVFAGNASRLRTLKFRLGVLRGRALRLREIRWRKTVGEDDASTGIAGLDDILAGGSPATGSICWKAARAPARPPRRMSFLRAGAQRARRPSTSPSPRPRRSCATPRASHGWDLDGVEIFELVPPESLLDEQQQQSLLYSSDLELGETTRMIFEAVERMKPRRVVIDSLSEIRLLAQSSLRYRRQVLALKHYFAKHGATVLLLDDLTTETLDKTVHSVAHGVVRLEELAPEYGAERRRVRIIKYRGRKFRGGYPRLHHPHRRPGGLSAPGLRRTQDRLRPQPAAQRRRGPRRRAGRRRRARLELPDPGSRRHRQVAGGALLRPLGHQARREGGAVRLR